MVRIVGVGLVRIKWCAWQNLGGGRMQAACQNKSPCRSEGTNENIGEYGEDEEVDCWRLYCWRLNVGGWKDEERRDQRVSISLNAVTGCPVSEWYFIRSPPSPIGSEETTVAIGLGFRTVHHQE